jgi:uncharacterized membrane protein YhfC
MSKDDWWRRQRLRYNAGILLAGAVAFIVYAAVVDRRSATCPGFEITAFTIGIQGVGFLFAVGAANLFYNLGRWSEIRLSPRNVRRYRRWAFGLGLAFSVALPFCAPVAAAVSSCLQV